MMVPYLGWGSAASTHGKQTSREESEVNDLVADGVLARSVVVAASLGDSATGVVERRQNVVAVKVNGRARSTISLPMA